jgi:hypothetical protein
MKSTGGKMLEKNVKEREGENMELSVCIVNP